MVAVAAAAGFFISSDVSFFFFFLVFFAFVSFLEGGCVLGKGREIAYLCLIIVVSFSSFLFLFLERIKHI